MQECNEKLCFCALPHYERAQQSCHTARHLEEALLCALASRAQNMREQCVHGDVQHRERQPNEEHIGYVVKPNIHLAQALAPTLNLGERINGANSREFVGVIANGFGIGR